MKKRVLLIIIILSTFVLFSATTYSFFHSSTKLVSSDQGIAKFIFDAKETDQINLDISNILPGDSKEYAFSVKNSNEEKTSDVTIKYQITIKTYHFIPLNIELYKKVNNVYLLVGKCDETYNRNSNNELICNMGIEEIENSTSVDNTYKIKVIFPKENNDAKYSNLVDYISVELSSWQKI